MGRRCGGLGGGMWQNTFCVCTSKFHNQDAVHCVVHGCWNSEQKWTVISGIESISWNPKHTDESTWSARQIHLESWVQPGGCQEWRAALQGALASNVKLPWACTHTHTHTHTHALGPKAGTHIKESIWSAVSLELSTNFLLQRKTDERASHLLHTAQSDSASQIHNSPHTAFWGVAIETLLGSSGQKMRGDERGYFPPPPPSSLPPCHHILSSERLYYFSIPWLLFAYMNTAKLHIHAPCHN